MYYEQYQPYHQTASDPELYAMEMIQEQEWSRMASYYSAQVLQIHDAVAQQCRRLYFDGSFLYDEYPDAQTIRSLVADIRRQLKPLISEPGNGVVIQSRSNDFLEDLIQVLLLQEIAQRRCRGHRCRHHMHNKR